MATLISVPAGRCLRRSPNQKWVDPQPEKGLLEMKVEDELMHLWWKSRVTGAVEDELIIFPGEATFEKVQQDPTGRTHILKFSSSDQKYFFWFQRASSATDARAALDIDELLQDPMYRIGSTSLPATVPATPAAPSPDRSYPPTPGAPRLSHPVPGPPIGRSNLINQATPAPATGSTRDLTSAVGTTSTGMEVDNDATAGSSHEEMARLLVQWARQGGMGAVNEDASLTDVLSPQNISTLIRTNPNLAQKLVPLLPPSLEIPETASADLLIPILTAPQITDAISSLENALRSGGLPGGMMVELGLPESAGTGVEEFLEGLKGLKKEEAGDAMETD